MEHIDLEAFITPSQTRGRRTPEIDPIQQDIYDYIESLEKRDAAKISTSNQEEFQFSKPQEPLVINVLKQEIFELKTLNRYIQKENQTLKARSEIQRAVEILIVDHQIMQYTKEKYLIYFYKQTCESLINFEQDQIEHI